MRSWAAAASVLLPGLIAIAGSSLPLSAQGDVVEECQPEVAGTVDVAITYRPTTPNPLANLHGLRLVANDRSAMCAAVVHPGRTTLFRGVPPGEYTFHLNWNPIGRLPLSVPDTSIAISLDVPAENRVADCLEVEACGQALLDAPAYVEGAPEAYLFHLAAVLNGVRDPDEALCIRAPGEALEAVRERYPATRVGPDCAGGHFIRVADVERDGHSIIARLSAGILRPDRGSYWPTGYRCLIEDTGSEYRAVQCVISSMA